MECRLWSFLAALFNGRRIISFFTWFCTVVVLTLGTSNAPAAPLSIEILNAQYSTYVRTLCPSNGWLTPTFRTAISPSPVSDDLVVTGTPGGGGESRASAGLFSVESYSAVFNQSGTAAATNQIAFSPLSDQTQTLSLLFSSDFRYYFGEGSVELFDLTANTELWDYGWSGYSGTVPWTPPEGGYGPSSAELDPVTPFLSSHTYLLTMIVGINSASDTDEAMIQLQGLEAVPEPRIGCLLVLGLGGLAAFRRKVFQT